MAVSKKKTPQIARRVLSWYDQNARDLPWRVGPKAICAGEKPDPYRVWLSEIMLQQTTVATVTPRYDRFLTRWPTIMALAAAPRDDVLSEWAGLGYYARARNLHACAQVVAEGHKGIFPDTEDGLVQLPGVGAYTAAAVAAIAFDRPAVVVDGNIERIAARFFAVSTPMPKAKPELKARISEIWPKKRAGDFAQALMDIGATICKPKAPLCDECPLGDGCLARQHGDQNLYPVKAKKKEKPTRFGRVYALTNKTGKMLLEKRPERGLLGAMLGLPGSPWDEKSKSTDDAHAPACAPWRKVGEARHTFTHFHLVLDVYTAKAPARFRPKRDQSWLDAKATSLPTVMKKAVRVALDSA